MLLTMNVTASTGPVSHELVICGLVYTVVFAHPDNVPDLRGNEGCCISGANTIFIREGMPPSRTRDAILHEVTHAFLEASGIRHLLLGVYNGTAFDDFEETLIRILVPSVLRLIDDNGRGLVASPKAKRKAPAKAKEKGRKAR